MAYLSTSAKSSALWTAYDLKAYNVRIQQDHSATFGISNLPPPAVDHELLTTENARDMASDSNAQLVDLLDMATRPPTGSEESAVVDFVVRLFEYIGYARRHRIARTRKDIHYMICGEQRKVRMDVCLIGREQNGILLLVQEDRRNSEGSTQDPVPQLIANAIAAFDYNNSLRRAVGEEPLEAKVSNFTDLH